MKIGLVRHFKVKTDYPEGLTAKEYIDWLRLYDELDTIPSEVDMKGIDWNKCYASSLARAYKTAEAIFDGEVFKSEDIVEVDLKFRKILEGKKTVVEWGRISTEHWRNSNGISGENAKESSERVNKFLDRLEKENNEDDNILIVCHELIMTVLEKELRKRGFEGESTSGARNGGLFLFEK